MLTALKIIIHPLQSLYNKRYQLLSIMVAHRLFLAAFVPYVAGRGDRKNSSLAASIIQRQRQILLLNDPQTHEKFVAPLGELWQLVLHSLTSALEGTQLQWGEGGRRHHCLDSLHIRGMLSSCQFPSDKSSINRRPLVSW